MSVTHPRGSNHRAKFATLLRDCRDIVLVFTSAQLTELFNNSDEALLDFAEKAENNQMQSRFFEAMNEVRNKRPLVEQIFREQVTSAFDNFGQSGRASFLEDCANGQDGELSLISQEEMDESVAGENMISKARDAYFQQLYALSQRLAVINGGRKVEEQAVPASPRHLVSSFQTAAKELNLDVRTKLILFALFEKYILKQAKSIYDEFNDNLKNAGILPNLKPVYQRPKGQSDSLPDQAPDDRTEAETYTEAYTNDSTSDNLGEELFTSILDLMAARRGSSRSAPPPANPVPTETVLSAIDAIRPASSSTYTGGGTTDLGAIPNLEIDQAFLDTIRDTLSEERSKLFAAVDRDQMNAADADTIDLVGMLFEYMLNDPVLPNVAKALISHLHTPYLKVAIIDRRLLTDHEHPARVLLDIMVEAGGQWVYENDLKRGIYPAMQDVVDRILKEFTDNVALFDELLTGFRYTVEGQKRKTDVVEKRSQEAAQGREKLNIAKLRAAQEMKARTQQIPLPKVVADFLTQTWADKLIFILLRHPEGELSSYWKEALRTADELTWAFEPGTQKSDRQELEKTLPVLRKAIQTGLESLGGVHQSQCDALFRLLEDPASYLEEDSEAEIEEAVTATMTQAPVSPEIPAQSSEPEISATTSSTDAAAPEPAEATPTPEEQNVMKHLGSLEFGTWFELTVPPADKPHQVKLSWLSPLTSTCMFVERSGVQATLMSVHEVAVAILEGRAKILEETQQPFVERTMKAIRGMLQRNAKKSG